VQYAISKGRKTQQSLFGGLSSGNGFNLTNEREVISPFTAVFPLAPEVPDGEKRTGTLRPAA
jgi:hypothetical protein